ncbi:MAG: hypothetical protein ACLGG7_07430 [Bacteriovoracia bacterium]
MKTINLTHIFGIMGLLLALNMFGKAHAASDIVCETAFGEKSFVIEADRVVFSKETDEHGRSISSVDQVRTERRHKGFDKVLFKDGLKHRIHIENPATLSEVDDYMVITSPKGHEMTYPLSCRKS